MFSALYVSYQTRTVLTLIVEISTFYGGKHPSELPFYSQRAAAAAVGVSFSTLRNWISPSRAQEKYRSPIYLRPLIEIPKDADKKLSFLNLGEAYAVKELISKAGATPHTIRMYVGYARERGESRPLLSREILAGGDIFRMEGDDLVTWSKSGQFAFRTILEDYIDRIDNDPDGTPSKLYPWVVNSVDKSVEINPRVKFGRPVISGTAIMTSTVAERFEAGESIERIARGYEIEPRLIEHALRYERRS